MTVLYDSLMVSDGQDFDKDAAEESLSASVCYHVAS